jgi:3-phenylpropionate/trans-cinnamate dioxygenase ferredoxin component
VDDNSWLEVAGVEELPEGRSFRIELGSDSFLLLKTSDVLYAIGNQCTHQGATLDRGVVKVAGSVRTVTCPAHGSMFDLETGKVMRPPATKPVPVYDVKIEDGRVYVRPRAEG